MNISESSATYHSLSTPSKESPYHHTTFCLPLPKSHHTTIPTYHSLSTPFQRVTIPPYQLTTLCLPLPKSHHTTIPTYHSLPNPSKESPYQQPVNHICSWSHSHNYRHQTSDRVSFSFLSKGGPNEIVWIIGGGNFDREILILDLSLDVIWWNLGLFSFIASSKPLYY